MSNYSHFLSCELEKQNIVFSKDQLGSLLKYIDLIIEWNKIYNLISFRSHEELIQRHIVDSLLVLPYLPKDPFYLLDVGSGAGLPGIPLSIMRDDISSCLVDCQEKRFVFMRQACSELHLSHVTIHQGHIEKMHGNIYYDVIISRAFSSLKNFVNCSRHLVSPGGYWLAMKGLYPEDEISSMPESFFVSDVFPIHVNGMNVSRYLLKIKC